MSVTRSEQGVILLSGDCPLEDAEPLLRWLAEDPGASVDWSGCDQAHTAVVQVLMAVKPRIVGSPTNSFVRKHLAEFV